MPVALCADPVTPRGPRREKPAAAGAARAAPRRGTRTARSSARTVSMKSSLPDGVHESPRPHRHPGQARGSRQPGRGCLLGDLADQHGRRIAAAQSPSAPPRSAESASRRRSSGALGLEQRELPAFQRLAELAVGVPEPGSLPSTSPASFRATGPAGSARRPVRSPRSRAGAVAPADGDRAARGPAARLRLPPPWRAGAL